MHSNSAYKLRSCFGDPESDFLHNIANTERLRGSDGVGTVSAAAGDHGRPGLLSRRLHFLRQEKGRRVNSRKYLANYRAGVENG